MNPKVFHEMRMLTPGDRINNSYDTVTWERMVVIKQRILQIWDTAPPTVRICCIKFAQRVVLAQTVSSMGDHRVCDLATFAETLLTDL